MMNSRICLSLAVMIACMGRIVQATTYTWDTLPGAIGNGNNAIDDGSGTWDTTTGNWTSDGGTNNVAWPNNTTDIAAFNGSTGGAITVSESLSAGGLLFSGTGTNSYVFTGAGNPTLTLGSSGITVSSAAGAQTLNNLLSGNNALVVNGGGTLTLGGANTFTGVMNFGDTSAGNTVYVADRLTGATAYSFNVGRNAFGNNSVDISGVGNSIAQTVLLSGNSSSFWVGGEGSASSGNRVTIRNGAYFRAAGGNGTTNSKMGSNAGSSNNSFTVTGVNLGTGDKSTLSHSGQRFYVGELGSSNTLQVSDGGQVLLRVFHVGAGGSNNAVFITGSGSFLSVTEDMLIGNGANGTNNSVTVSSGASLSSQTRSGRTEISCNIGTAAGANDNSLTITGAGSMWTDNGNQVVIGGSGTPSAPAWQAATNNSLNITSGGSAVINTGVILSGVNSSFDLGDGNNISTVSVGSARDGGISLSVADARLNLNGGRLIANADGVLVSGPGLVQLSGSNYVSTTQPGSTIDSVIAGDGSLTKEGSGMLTLSAVNTYTGNTTVASGTLAIIQRCLNDKADVYLVSGSTLKLNFSGDDKIGGLYFNGEEQPQGPYGAGTLDGAIIGTGRLMVTKGPALTGCFLIIR